jgi:DNA-binding NarL/FixJ family response regulator
MWRTSRTGFQARILLCILSRAGSPSSNCRFIPDRAVASNYRNTGSSFVNRGATDRTIRVIIAEDHTLMAQGLRKLLECEFESVTIVGNGRELIDSVATSKPDVALVDIVMPLLSGIEATRRLRKVSPTTKIVIVTAHSDPQYVVEAFRAGASGFVLKRCAVAELVVAIRCVLAGQTYITPLLADRAVEAATESAPGPVLTSRQREVLQLVAEGCTAKEIANALKLSVKTAVFHKMAIMDKLGLHSTAELTRYAMEHGIITTTNSLRAKGASGPS